MMPDIPLADVDLEAMQHDYEYRVLLVTAAKQQAKINDELAALNRRKTSLEKRAADLAAFLRRPPPE